MKFDFQSIDKTLHSHFGVIVFMYLILIKIVMLKPDIKLFVYINYVNSNNFTLPLIKKEMIQTINTGMMNNCIPSKKYRIDLHICNMLWNHFELWVSMLVVNQNSLSTWGRNFDGNRSLIRILLMTIKQPIVYSFMWI